MKISAIHARQIIDSRGNPTVETDVTLEDSSFGRAAVPSGASTGSNEAVELRDNDQSHYGGLGVLKAVQNVNAQIAPKLIGQDASNQRAIDEALIALDGTDNKSHLGANAILSVSLAVAKAAANSAKQPFCQYCSGLQKAPNGPLLPTPMMNIINGGKHAANSTDIQEFMIIPASAPTFAEAVRMGSEVFHALGTVLAKHGYATTLGDEGGYAPHVTGGNTEALDLIAEAVKAAGYTLGSDILLAIDVAASELFTDGKYHLKTENRVLTSDEMISWLTELTERYPIASIEDGLAENDWPAWTKLTAQLGGRIQLVGDDLLVTNTRFLERGIQEQAANAILIKLNQIGTLSETIDAVEIAKLANWKAIISHRSGETEDTTIADLAVGLGTGQIKTGSVARGERTAKYNQLIRLEEQLGAHAQFLGGKSLHYSQQ